MHDVQLLCTSSPAVLSAELQTIHPGAQGLWRLYFSSLFLDNQVLCIYAPVLTGHIQKRKLPILAF